VHGSRCFRDRCRNSGLGNWRGRGRGRSYRWFRTHRRMCRRCSRDWLRCKRPSRNGGRRTHRHDTRPSSDSARRGWRSCPATRSSRDTWGPMARYGRKSGRWLCPCRRSSRRSQGSSFGRCRPRYLFGFHGSLGCREITEMLAREFGMLNIERTRVRLLFGHADFREKIDQDFGLDLQFPCQLVDSDLMRF